MFVDTRSENVGWSFMSADLFATFELETSFLVCSCSDLRLDTYSGSRLDTWSDSWLGSWSGSSSGSVSCLVTEFLRFCTVVDKLCVRHGLGSVLGRVDVLGVIKQWFLQKHPEAPEFIMAWISIIWSLRCIANGVKRRERWSNPVVLRPRFVVIGEEDDLESRALSPIKPRSAVLIVCSFFLAKRLSVLVAVSMKPSIVVGVSVCASMSRISPLRPSSNSETSADPFQSNIGNVQCSVSPVKRENINPTLVLSEGHSY
ncbi:hypothetical protein BB560_000611 [Smittium megazygosporum]|uniref:Uncharacterized protein n=1 Tax=Smittium megazygosporum TaxID=133381 RepID=A0A2T9ZJW9_9FUNG|nr:hypothetical protein BB560_000613 [Smittium megazygosporum]PVV04867.1 hypothetical protein BB560_000611 [Smittium megazygosporum]